MAATARRTAHLIVRLATLDDLFRAPEPNLFAATGRLISGMDELITELQARRLPRGLSTTIMLEHEATAVDAARIAALIHRYCDIRLRELDGRLRSQRREQRYSLLVGLLLFVLGVGLASEFTASYWPGELKSLLGEGIFLVVAWVGLWYPIDYLVFGRRPLLRERKALQVLRTTEVTVERAPRDAGARHE